MEVWRPALAGDTRPPTQEDWTEVTFRRVTEDQRFEVMWSGRKYTVRPKYVRIWRCHNCKGSVGGLRLIDQPGTLARKTIAGEAVFCCDTCEHAHEVREALRD